MVIVHDKNMYSGMRFKMSLLCFILPFTAFGAEPWQQAKIKIHVIRHGQRILPRDFSCDPSLTKNGIKQAELTGAELKRKGFQGNIYSSPYRRTLETASIIAEVLDCKIYLCAEVQEYMPRSGIHPIPQRTMEELKKEFPRIAGNSMLQYPWLVSGPENFHSLQLRIQNMLNRILPHEKKPDILFVTHGAILKGFQLLMTGRADKKMPMNWNCALSIYRLDGKSQPYVEQVFDVSFLPEKLITSNEISKSETPDRNQQVQECY
jgi:broad specificity phosphatase PhoE